ncbi:MAG: PD-(D/E)XK nuclease family protein [Spirochaetaceae bacterium]|nr:MAG: PD-(D/E)XK nuclease family protein [Spirochaetaceae bacterium]
MEHSLESMVLALLDDPAQVLVVPSEVVARFWRQRAVAPPRPPALSANRIISWDSFKESHFDLRQAATPVNATLRRVFATGLLHENREAPFLQAVVSAAHRENSVAFAGYLQRAIPSLRALAERGAFDRPREPLLRDLAEVYRRYRAFLDRNALFEPGWVTADIPEPSRPHVILFPRLIDDFPQFADALSRLATVRCVDPVADEAGMDRTASQPVWLQEFANAHQEVTAVIARIEALLDAGIPAHEIAVTVAELPEYQPFLARAAALHEVPLLFRAGAMLSDYPPGRFCRALLETPTADFSFRAVRALVGDRAVPWRDRSMGDALIRAAIEGGCLKRNLGTEDDGEQWLRAIRAWNPGTDEGGDRTERREALAEYYRGLRDALLGMGRASSAGELRQRMFAFRDRFLDSDAWDADNLRAFQRCMAELNKLVAVEQRLGTTLAQSGALWMAVLEQTPYVPRAAHDGVSVYPYRVAAGVAPRVHIVMNASHDGTRVYDTSFRFLDEQTRARLELGERDSSDDFLDVYRVSGRTVLFTCSRRSFAGPRFPAGTLAHGASGEAPRDENHPADARHEPYFHERELWADGLVRLPARLYPPMRSGLERFAGTGGAARTVDFARHAITDQALVERLLESRTAGVPQDALEAAPRGAMTRAELRLSASAIDSYRACPFGHLLSGPLGLDEVEFAVTVEPAKEIGIYQHHVLQQLYQRLSVRGPILPDDRETVLAELDAVIAETETDWSQLRTVPRPIATVIRRTTREGIAALLEAERHVLTVHEVVETEADAELSLPEEDVRLTGRIDRVSRTTADGALVLIDYKRRNAPSRTSAIGRNGTSEGVTTVQLLMYLLLLQDRDAPVRRIYYYQVEKGKITPIVEPDGKHALPDEAREALLVELRAIIGETATGMRGGDYRFPDPMTGCEKCRYRAVCRARFAVE